MASKAYELATLARDATTLTGNAQTMGDANTLDGHDSSYFAVATHNHDSWYLKLEGGTLTGYLTVHATPTDDMHVSNKKYVDDQIATNFTSLSSSKADANHNHDSQYSNTAHNHAGDYSPLGHHHDDRYLRLAGGAITGAITVQEPILSSHPATKTYVDNTILSELNSYDYGFAQESHAHSEYALASALTSLASTSYVDTALADKLNTTDFNTTIQDYALKTYVDNAVSDKATTSYVSNNLALKADKSELELKADATSLAQTQSELDALEAIAVSNTTFTTTIASYTTTSDMQTLLADKANNTVVTDLATNKADITYVDTKISDLVGTAPATLDTLQEISLALQNDPDVLTNLFSSIGLKADRTYVDAQIASHNHTSGGGGSTGSVAIQELGPYDSQQLKVANGDGSDDHIGFLTNLDSALSVQVYLNGIRLIGPLVEDTSSTLDSSWNSVTYDYIAYKNNNDIVFESHVNMTSNTILQVTVITS